MRSILLVLSACGAVSHASECQAADEVSMLQGRSKLRLQSTKTKQTDALLKSVRDVAYSLSEGSMPKSRDEVNEALDAASEALAELAPAIRQQVVNAQQQIAHAGNAVMACHAQDGVNTRARLQQHVEQRAVAVETCQAELQVAIAEEEEACARAEDCLCDEARTRRADKTELCASMTETYEIAFCEHHLLCTTFHECHANEMEVYDALRADVEAEMATLQQEYIAVEQSSCLTDLIMQAMTPPLTPISHAALIACNDVDVSALAINFPELPATPAACPEPTIGAPECVGAPEAPKYDDEDLWHQTFVDRTKCNDNIGVQYVASRQDCEAVAVAAGHEFYSFRHNANDQGHKCFSSRNCDEENGLLLGNRNNEWRVYRRSFPHPAVLANAHSFRRIFAQDWNNHEQGVGAAGSGELYADQRWVIEDAGDGNDAYVIRNEHSGRRLFAQDSGNHESGVGAGRGDTIFADQKWFIVPTDDEAVGGMSQYIIRNVHSGRRLFAQANRNHEDGFGASNGDTVYADQKWFITPYQPVD